LKGFAGSVFLAETDRSEIIVKFVEFYGKEVHEELSDKEMAPLIHALVECHTFKMVVMDFEPEAHSWKPTIDGADNAMTTQLKKILNHLEEKKFVHGDLRSDNLLVCSGGKVKLIDFDWAGREGTAQYPVQLNPGLTWHEDASVGSLIKVDHDKFMATQLISDSHR
jgi:serine/threonine protein kinase